MCVRKSMAARPAAHVLNISLSQAVPSSSLLASRSAALRHGQPATLYARQTVERHDIAEHLSARSSHIFPSLQFADQRVILDNEHMYLLQGGPAGASLVERSMRVAHPCTKAGADNGIERGRRLPRGHHRVDGRCGPETIPVSAQPRCPDH